MVEEFAGLWIWMEGLCVVVVGLDLGLCYVVCLKVVLRARFVCVLGEG